MTIRVKCESCGAVLKIKDKLAGTDGKCPKCKSPFVVPAFSDVAAVEDGDMGHKEGTPHPAFPPMSQAKPATAQAAAKKDAEFDPIAFLLDDSEPGAKASAGLTTPDPATKKSATDSRGRRQIVAPPPVPNRGADGRAADPAKAPFNASANARDLLTKTMEESRVKAASMPAETRRPQIDIIGSLYPLIDKSPYVIGLVVVVVLLYYLSTAMVGGRVQLPPLARVAGKVQVDGQPLANVTVYLTPIERDGQSKSGNKIRLRTPAGITDEKGAFYIEYMQGVSGAPIGKVRISIQPNNLADYTRIPLEYQMNQFNTDVREVKPSGNEGKFDLVLKSR